MGRANTTKATASYQRPTANEHTQSALLTSKHVLDRLYVLVTSNDSCNCKGNVFLQRGLAKSRSEFQKPNLCTRAGHVEKATAQKHKRRNGNNALLCMHMLSQNAECFNSQWQV
jgi:hypothetical protein